MNKQKNPQGKCEKCGITTQLHLRYAGWSVGWFCNDHRPDKDSSKQQVRDILKGMMTKEQENGPPILVFPRSWLDKRHPFHQVAQGMVDAKTACWATEIIHATISEALPIKLNRAQRRANMKENKHGR